MVLLYGVRATTVAALTTEHLSTGPRGTYLRLGDTTALPSPTLAELITDPRHNLTASTPPSVSLATRSLGQPPTRPINPASLSALLGRHGIPARASRNTALIALAIDLPASSLPAWPVSPRYGR